MYMSLLQCEDQIIRAVSYSPRPNARARIPNVESLGPNDANADDHRTPVPTSLGPRRPNISTRNSPYSRWHPKHQIRDTLSH
jgi:hypothetical protein